MKELSGIGASPGKSLGRARIWRDDAENRRATAHSAGTPQQEWQRIESARTELLQSLEERASRDDVAAELFAAHGAILSDLSLIEMLQEGVHVERLSAEAAVEATLGDFVALFSALDDPLFAARANDVRDLEAQLLRLLVPPLQDNQPSEDELQEGTILVANDLMPSDVARLDPARVVGIALAHGSPLAHAAILARSMGIPMVCHLGDTLLDEAAGMDCWLDGDQGRLVVEPEPSIALAYDTSPERGAGQAQEAWQRLTIMQQTRDQVAVSVLANLNTMDELTQIAHFGADGIGLLRTEFLFARERDVPSADTQAQRFAEILRALGDAPLYVRAFDFGGDKHAPWLAPASREEDADLRGIRLLLAHPDILRDQYTALLRAVELVSQEKEHSQQRVRYLLPMIALPEEMESVRAFLDEVAAAEELTDLARTVEIGAMIEIPSAALMAGEIAVHCQMISIGSNDLAQFIFAGDRSQQDASALADALHPAVLRVIRQICASAALHSCPVSLCGEVAGNPLATPLLLGLGVTEFSVAPHAAPVVKAAIGQYTLEECRALAEQALAAPGLATVQGLLSAFPMRGEVQADRGIRK
jgi:phosphocarrier protein FPr